MMSSTFDPSHERDRHYEAQETQHYADLAEQLERALRERDEGRNRECWPLHSFGWKDADLDPGGCTGIKRLVKATEAGVTLKIGGHKVLAPSETVAEYANDNGAGEMSTQEWIEHGIACDVGYSGEWSGEYWDLHHEEEIFVPWQPEDDEPNITATATVVIEKARAALEPFSSATAAAEKGMMQVPETVRAYMSGELD